MRKANIYFKDHYAGLLEETEQGFIFKYDPLYLKEHTQPISLTLP